MSRIAILSDAHLLIQAERFRDRYPSAMECLANDLDECLTYLKFPQAHWRAIRTSNLVERTFG